MKKGRFRKAYKSLTQLRGSPIQAAKEMIELDAQIQAAEAKLISRIADEEEDVVNVTSPDHPRTAESKGQTAPDDQSSQHSSQSDGDDSDGSDVDDDSDDDSEPIKLRQRVSRGFNKFKGVFKQDQKDDGDPTTFEARFKLTNYWTRISQLITVPRTRRASKYQRKSCTAIANVRKVWLHLWS
jgi:hypothetical protein